MKYECENVTPSRNYVDTTPLVNAYVLLKCVVRKLVKLRSKRLTTDYICQSEWYLTLFQRQLTPLKEWIRNFYPQHLCIVRRLVGKEWTSTLRPSNHPSVEWFKHNSDDLLVFIRSAAASASSSSSGIHVLYSSIHLHRVAFIIVVITFVFVCSSVGQLQEHARLSLVRPCADMPKGRTGATF